MFSMKKIMASTFGLYVYIKPFTAAALKKQTNVKFSPYCTGGKNSPKHSSKGSNCTKTIGALKAVASLGPYGSLSRAGARTITVRPLRRKRVDTFQISCNIHNGRSDSVVTLCD